MTTSTSRTRTVALWISQIAVAGMFLFAGGSKLAGAAMHVQLFDALGLGQWFRYVTGSIEVIAALMLLTPQLAIVGALLAVPTMAGAIATHLFIVGGSATPAIVLLALATAIVWLRRHQLTSFNATHNRRFVMKRSIAALLVVAIGIFGAHTASAQEAAPGPGRVEVTLIPGGATFFVKGTDTGEPSFGNYDLGGAATFNINRYVGLEGEVGGSLGFSQSLEFPTVTADVKTPHLLQYSGNLVVSAPTQGSVVPYVTGGVGGLNLFEKASLGIGDTQTFLTGNVGGGVKWYAGRWGLRGDYRFVTARSQDDAPEFFGRETRFGHRVYGGVIFNVVR